MPVVIGIGRPVFGTWQGHSNYGAAQPLEEQSASTSSWANRGVLKDFEFRLLSLWVLGVRVRSRKLP